MVRFAFSADDTLWHKELETYFLSLIEICDSFDQLGKLAVILDHLYGPLDPEHKPLFKQIEKTARHLAGLPPLDQGDQGDQGDQRGPCCPVGHDGPEGEPGLLEVGRD